MNARTENEAQTTAAKPGVRNGLRDLHVKGLPESTWIRARCNATQSGMSFKEYVIRILEGSQPLPHVKR